MTSTLSSLVGYGCELWLWLVLGLGIVLGLVLGLVNC